MSLETTNLEQKRYEIIYCMKTEDDERPVGYRKRNRRWFPPCTRKIHFLSYSDAFKAKHKIFMRGRGFCRIYECGNHFHLTSQI